MNNNVFLTPNIPQYWENLYAEGKDTWSLGKATPALLDFFEHPLCPKNGNVLVPLAGKGLDAEAWAIKGHKVLAVDFCPTALDALEMMHGNDNLATLNRDVFLLSSQDENKGGEKFDIIYDYCAFNCVHIHRRDHYVETWLKMLKDDGLVVAFFYPLCKESNQSLSPFNATDERELVARFSGLFNIEKRIVPKKSVKERVGKEEIWLLRKARKT
ncbi:MAG: methyltransferase domain-containing protein [Fibromonadaceae bacterium]|jgi:cyclopropane fatty-acyl-phospholipid synthase-like methyltransferase|nr:methyltransferase domain-containing protein [Fibromonadaceae bacterium]